MFVAWLWGVRELQRLQKTAATLHISIICSNVILDPYSVGGRHIEDVDIFGDGLFTSLHTVYMYKELHSILMIYNWISTYTVADLYYSAESTFWHIQ